MTSPSSMPRLVPIRGLDLIRLFKKQGFRQVRQEGSHVRLAHPDGRKTSVPIHRGEQLGTGLLRKILRDVNITPEAFDKMRRG